MTTRLRRLARLDPLTIASFTRPVSSDEINEALRKDRERQARKFRRDGERFTPIDAGFPRALYLIFDHVKRDTITLADRRHPWFTTLPAALRAADRLNRAVGANATG